MSSSAAPGKLHPVNIGDSKADVAKFVYGAGFKGGKLKSNGKRSPERKLPEFGMQNIFENIPERKEARILLGCVDANKPASVSTHSAVETKPQITTPLKPVSNELKQQHIRGDHREILCSKICVTDNLRFDISGSSSFEGPGEQSSGVTSPRPPASAVKFSQSKTSPRKGSNIVNKNVYPSISMLSMDRIYVQMNGMMGSATAATTVPSSRLNTSDLSSTAKADTHGQSTQEGPHDAAVTPSSADGENAEKQQQQLKIDNNLRKILAEYELEEWKSFDDRIYFSGLKPADKIQKHGEEDIANNYGFDNHDSSYKAIIGDHLGFRYEILKQLGLGSFGDVYMCKDHKTAELVAIKIMKRKKR